MKILGISDDVTVCELCGKSNLKRTVALETATGNIVHYGCDCAAKSLRTKSNGLNTRDMNQVADLIAYVNAAIDVHTMTVTGNKVWNKFGYCTEIKHGVLSVWTAVGKIEFTQSINPSYMAL